jgi:hypothetical protein
MTKNNHIASVIDIDDGMNLHCRRTSISGAMYDARLIREDTHNIRAACLDAVCPYSVVGSELIV